MSQPRVDIYNFPHKGLRNLLSQVSFMAGNTDHSNQQALDELIFVSCHWYTRTPRCLTSTARKPQRSRLSCT